MPIWNGYAVGKAVRDAIAMKFPRWENSVRSVVGAEVKSMERGRHRREERL